MIKTRCKYAGLRFYSCCDSCRLQGSYELNKGFCVKRERRTTSSKRIFSVFQGRKFLLGIMEAILRTMSVGVSYQDAVVADHGNDCYIFDATQS